MPVARILVERVTSILCEDSLNYIKLVTRKQNKLEADRKWHVEVASSKDAFAPWCLKVRSLTRCFKLQLAHTIKICLIIISLFFLVSDFH